MGLMTSHSQKVDLNMAPGTKHCEFILNLRIVMFGVRFHLYLDRHAPHGRPGAGQDGDDHSVGEGPRPSHIHPGALPALAIWHYLLYAQEDYPVPTIQNPLSSDHYPVTTIQ